MTTSSITGTGDNYYILVDAGSSAYVMANDASHYRPCYKTIADPVANPSFVWILEGSENTFAFKSFSTGSYFIQANGWDTSMTGATGSATFTFTLNDGKYTINCVQHSGLVGHWNDDGAGVKEDGESIAANKGTANAPGFYLYAISKSAYNAAIVASRFATVATATKASPVDVTSYIQNADWSGDFGGWARSGSWGNQQCGQKTLESWNNSNVSVTQTISGVPNGQYKLTVDMISGNDNKNAYVYAKGDQEVNGDVVSAKASAGDYTTMSNEVAGNTLTADNIKVTNDVITVGFKDPSTDDGRGWIVADNFKLYYYGPNLAASSALPDGDMTAGTWYYFDVAIEGSYNLTCTSLSDIVYTTDGSILIEDAASATTSSFTESSVQLSVGRYYVKSSSAQTFTVTPSTFTYVVGSATPSIANDSYQQTLTTVSFNFEAATSNNPAATFALLNGSAVATLKKAGSAVKTGTLSLEGKVLTATFSDVTLDMASAYTIELPAGVVGYEGQAQNEAVTVNFNTPTIADGVYYIKNNSTSTYISRGGNYNTQAILDNYGLAFIVSTDASNQTQLQYFDSHLWLGDDENCYGDCGESRRRFFNLTKVDGGYKFLNTNNSKYLAANGGATVANAETGDVWTLESTADHVANYTTNANTQAVAAASAAGLSGISTKADLESQLANNYVAVSVAITGSKAEKYQAYPGNGKESGPVKYYSETVNGLKPGIYKLSVDAFQRAAGYDRVAAADGARSLIYLYAGDAKTQLKSVMEYGASDAYESDNENGGKHYPSNESSAYVALETGNYTNDVYVYVADAGEGTGSLEIGISNPTRLGGNFATWAAYNNWTLTRYAPNSEKFYATASHSYVQEGNEVTITYDELLNIIPKPTISSSISGVTFNGGSVECTPTENGFKFTVPAVSAGSTYTLSIPDGAVCSGRTAAQSITLKTPAVLDGVFFIKQNDADKYVSRGGNDNTEAILDSYGIPVEIKTDGDNVSLVKFLDCNRYLYAGSSSVYSDKPLNDGGDNVKWTIASYSGGYSFYNSARGKYIAAGTGEEDPKVPAAIRTDSPYAWVLENPAAHPAKLQAVKDAQAAGAAYAAGYSASTQAALASALVSANMMETSIAITGVASVSEQYQQSAQKGNSNNRKYFSETKTGLSKGLYRLRVYGFERIAGLDAVLSAGGAAGLTRIYAGDQEVQLWSVAAAKKEGAAWSDGTPGDVAKPEGFYVNNTTSADAAFDAGNYANDLYFYLDSDNSEIEFGIKTTNSYGDNKTDEVKNSQWVCYNNISLVRFEAKASAEEKQALANALDAVKDNVFGFEAGEYAPYNNVAACQALAAVKDLDLSKDVPHDLVVAATAALTGSWTANTAEVNAIYDGDFAIQIVPKENTRPLGWARHSATANSNDGNDGGWETRLVALPEGSSSTDKGMMTKYHAFYGDQAGYQLPLKANTNYALTFRYAGWNDNAVVHINVYSEDGTPIAQSDTFTSEVNNGDKSAEGWTDYSFVFKTAEAGNYVIGLIKNTGGTEQKQMGFGDISLVKAATATMSITDAQYATFCAPFDVTIPEGVAAYTVTGLNQEAKLTLTDVETTIPANTPVVIFSESTVNKEFAGAAVQGTPSTGLLTGVYADTAAPVGSYVLQNLNEVVGFYKVAEGNQPTVKANHAYLTTTSGARALFFDNATAIRAIEALTSGEAEIYNAAGTRQNSLQKGVNIIKQGNKTFKVMVK